MCGIFQIIFAEFSVKKKDSKIIYKKKIQVSQEQIALKHSFSSVHVYKISVWDILGQKYIRVFSNHSFPGKYSAI